MPVAIVMSKSDVIPAILSQDAPEKLLAAINALTESPALQTEADARNWLNTLPMPSGWYATPEDALTAARRLRQSERLGGAVVAEARAALGLSRADFAEAIGYGGNSNTRHKTIFEVEKGLKTLSDAASRALRALMAEHGLDQ